MIWIQSLKIGTQIQFPRVKWRGEKNKEIDKKKLIIQKNQKENLPT